MNPQQLTEEQQKRVSKFLEEYGELTKKHNVDFVNFPLLTPNKEGKWEMSIQTQPMVTDSIPGAVKSPFM